MIVACIPAYNEESTIPRIILGAKNYVDKILVCDDGSQDLTAEIANALGAQVIRHDRNLGKGAALRVLFAAAQALEPEATVVIDADGQHNPDEIPKLLRPILKGQADLVIGSRYLGSTEMPNYRRMGARVLDRLTSLNMPIRVKDTQSGFRAFSLNSIKQLTIATDGFQVESEVLIKATALGLRVVEVPVTMSYEGDTSTKNPVAHANEVAGYLIRKSLIAHPILSLGIPGAVLLFIGLYSFLTILNSFYQSGYFSIPQALISFTLFIVGAVTMLFSLTLLAINMAMKEKRGK